MPVKMTHRNAALRVCVDQAAEDCVSGSVYSQRLREPMRFSGLGSLLSQVDAVLDAQNFPQAFQRTRTFRPKGERPVPACAADGPEDGMSAEAVEAARGELSTFLVYIITRQSTTWQGRVDWLDGSGMVSFSSALEFVRLVDERLSSK